MNRLKNTISVSVGLAVICLLSSGALAVNPPPDGGYPGNNTAEGAQALNSLVNGVDNTANGFQALWHDTSGSFNTGTGFRALFSNTTASYNSAYGFQALLRSTTGTQNTANGAFALSFDTTGSFNTATGVSALFRNGVGSQNTATGVSSLIMNTGGVGNTAAGYRALRSVTDGDYNVGIGVDAGATFVHASHNIAIGVPGAGPFADLNNTCFIGSIHGEPVSSSGTAQDVYVDANNVLGFLPSSKRFKHDIKPMSDASEKLYALKPVTFKYNSDDQGRTQYGVIAEQVAEVAPDLVFRDNDGNVQTVRAEQINMMLLNEFLKEHKKVERLQSQLEKTIAQLKRQEEQIQKVSAQLEVRRSAPKVVQNKP